MCFYIVCHFNGKVGEVITGSSNRWIPKMLMNFSPQAWSVPDEINWTRRMCQARDQGFYIYHSTKSPQELWRLPCFRDDLLDYLFHRTPSSKHDIHETPQNRKPRAAWLGRGLWHQVAKAQILTLLPPVTRGKVLFPFIFNFFTCTMHTDPFPCLCQGSIRLYKYKTFEAMSGYSWLCLEIDMDGWMSEEMDRGKMIPL